MKLSAIDFMRECSVFMHKDRPDLYETPEDALEDLDGCMNMLRDEDSNAYSFASFVLIRNDEDGVEEWLLTRKIAVMALFEQEGAVRVYGYTDMVDLPDAMNAEQDDEQDS